MKDKEDFPDVFMQTVVTLRPPSEFTLKRSGRYLVTLKEFYKPGNPYLDSKMTVEGELWEALYDSMDRCCVRLTTDQGKLIPLAKIGAWAYLGPSRKFKD